MDKKKLGIKKNIIENVGIIILKICFGYLLFTLLLTVFVILTYRGPIRLINSITPFTDNMLSFFSYLKLNIPAVDGEIPNFWRLWRLFLIFPWTNSFPNLAFISNITRNSFEHKEYVVFLLIFGSNILSIILTHLLLKKRDSKICLIVLNNIPKRLKHKQKYLLVFLLATVLVYAFIYLLNVFFEDLFRQYGSVSWFIIAFYIIFIGLLLILNTMANIVFFSPNRSRLYTVVVIFLMNSLFLFGGDIYSLNFMQWGWIEYELSYWSRIWILWGAFWVWICADFCNWSSHTLLLQEIQKMEPSTIYPNSKMKNKQNQLESAKNNREVGNSTRIQQFRGFNVIKENGMAIIVAGISWIIFLLLYYLWSELCFWL